MSPGSHQVDETSAEPAGVEQTRERILEGAYKVFGNKGYSGATTRAIAAEAEVNEVTLFRHFGSKKNLFEEMIAYYYQASGMDGFSPALMSGDLREDLTVVGSRIVLVLKERREIIRLLLSEVEAQSEVRNAMVTMPRQLRQLLARYLAYQMDHGKVRSSNPEVMAQAFMSMFMAFVLYETVFGESPVPEVLDQDLVSQFVDIFLQGVTDTSA